MPRPTIINMMVLVLIISLGLWTGSAAYHVRTEPAGSWLLHVGGDPRGSVTWGVHPAPFWPRYWRHLLGLAWPGSYVCPEGCWRSPGMGRRTLGTRAVLPLDMKRYTLSEDLYDEFVRPLAFDYLKEVGAGDPNCDHEGSITPSAPEPK
jgi:hypothetical protein